MIDYSTGQVREVMVEKDVFTIPEVAKLMKVSRYTVFSWIKKGYIKAFRPVKNGVWKITKEDLLGYMRENSVPFNFLDNNKIKLLIVDDEEGITELISGFYRKNDKFLVEIANSGFSAGIKLESFKPDIIILDIYLGDMDGREFFNYIHTNSDMKPVKVVGISGKVCEDEIKLLLKKGFSTFLHKPFKLEKLKETVENLI